MDLRYISGEQLMEEIRKKARKRRILTAVILVIGIILTVLCFNVAVGAGIVTTCFLVLIPLAVFWHYCKKIKNVQNIPLFRLHGSPEELAALIRNSSDSVLYQSNTFLLTSKYIMNPNNLETIIPLTDLQLAYIHTSSYNGIPTQQSLKTHDIYNNQVDYNFKLGKKGKAEIVEILTAIQQNAPWVIVGYSPQNVSYAAKNKIKVGDPKPVRQMPQNAAPAQNPVPPVMDGIPQ
ncbi:MAG: hypothetical protein IKI58_12960 [Oscillospiraceae bacterium]|nr:hypothetical protein [Oscillospiraceae bacterium]